jgi:hypothetical protein
MISMVTHAQGQQGGLRPDEYDPVGLIYDDVLSVLGDRALYPVCIDVRTDTPVHQLLRYLRKHGRAVSDPSLCEPAMRPNGQHHPRDYSHGLRIFVDRPQRYPGSQIDIHVDVGDLTVRPGEDLALELRRGTYHLRRDENREWQIVGYTKEYDSNDEKQKN